MTGQDLLTRLRMLLSEPIAGTWGTVEYEGEGETEADFVDELLLMINDAQVYTCRDIYDRGFAFFETKFRCPLITDTSYYTMPGDLLGIESVFQICGMERNQIENSRIKELQDTYPYGEYQTYARSNWYSYYELRGNGGSVILEGQAGEVPSGQTPDEFTVWGTFDTNTIAVGDTISNDIDGSSGRITEVHADRLIADYLAGGRTNSFEFGDIFRVHTRQQPFELLQVYPMLKSVKQTELYSGDPNGWEVKFTSNPTRVRFDIDLSTIPPEINPKKVRVFLAIQDADNNAVATGALMRALDKTNTVDVTGELQRSTPYYVSVVTADGTVIAPTSVRVLEADANNYLDITYTRLPTPIQLDTICEFPPYLLTPIIAYAKMLAYMKKTGMPQVDDALYNEYTLEVEKNKDLLRRRGESGNTNIYMNPHTSGKTPYNQGYAGAGYWLPTGFTPYYSP